MVRSLQGRFTRRLLAALALACAASCVAASTADAFANGVPAPATGLGSLKRIVLGPKGVDAQCITSSPDGSVWVLAQRNGSVALVLLDARLAARLFPGPR